MLKKLLEEKGVLFGSRALDVHTNTSDYDYAILEKDVLENLELFKGIKVGNAEEYLQNSPESPVAILFKARISENEKSDILILTNEEDLQTVADAVSDLQGVPTYMLKDKRTRIKLYQTALYHYGWNSRRPTLIQSIPRPGYAFLSTSCRPPSDTSYVASNPSSGVSIDIAMDTPWQ